MKQIMKSDRISEAYTVVDHPTGLRIILYPMAGFTSAYALFTTRYGSVDTTFKTDADDDFVTVPEGIAHFLEHKMFDAEDGDVFNRFALTGASANAYTSFDRTAYLFSTTDNVNESLEILLDFVQSPHFTPEKVEKEQGIIGQEIQMFDDDPEWRVFFNLLEALYQKHPVRIDIAGTIDSIAQIDDKLLYRCYNTFYNLHNMVLVLTGNFDVDEALAVADKILKPAPAIHIARGTVDEPAEVLRSRTVQDLEVAVPLFQIGFKAPTTDYPEDAKKMLYTEMLLEILCGEGSQLYRELYDSGLISPAFGAEINFGGGYFTSAIVGESRDPDAVFEQVKKAVRQLRAEGISDEDFELSRRIFYGRQVSFFGNVRSLGSLLLQGHIQGVDAYTMLDIVAGATKDDLLPLIDTHLNLDHAAISIVRPKGGEGHA